MGSRLGQRASKSACIMVPPLFRADLGTNLIKQGVGEGDLKGRTNDSVAQLAECLNGKRGALGWARFFPPVTFSGSVKVYS